MIKRREREEERERKKGRRRDIEREGEIRRCARSLFERKILVKSPEPENNAQRRVKKENPRE